MHELLPDPQMLEEFGRFECLIIVFMITQNNSHTMCPMSGKKDFVLCPQHSVSAYCLVFMNNTVT